ncbi:MAG: hypothetical protein ACKVT0_05805 [Planctomycetaceae bacterium]
MRSHIGQKKDNVLSYRQRDPVATGVYSVQKEKFDLIRKNAEE